MGTIDQKLINYVWNNLKDLESIFSEKIYKILLRFRDKNDKEGFSDTLGVILDSDDELLFLIKNKSKNIYIIYENIYSEKKDNFINLFKSKYSSLIKESLEEKEKLSRKEKNPKIKIKSFNELAKSYISIENHQKAEELYLEALEIQKKIFGDEHSDIANSYAHLAELYKLMKKYQKAEELYLEALEIQKKIFGDEYSDIANSYANLAELYKLIKKYQKAEELYLKALKIVDKEHPNSQLIVDNLDDFMKEQNRFFFLNSENSNLNFKVDKIEIKNFKQYKSKFIMEFSNQINIIIGQNSTGKTTLLQAITLALLKRNSNDAPSKIEYSNYITKDKEKAKITIWHNNISKKIKILKDAREVKNNYFIPFVLSYGSNIFTSPTNEVKEIAQGVVNKQINRNFTNSIFPYHTSYTNTFINPIRLLEFLDLEKDEEVVLKVKKTIIDTINQFLDGFKLIEVDKNYFFQKDTEETKLGLEDLSEGYRGNVLLITDMLIKILGVGWTPQTIEGIVLIDEFDKHLHPRWQSKLVNQLKETFPKIQFIMTTHNPMSILGRESDEITKLVEIDGEIKAVRGRGTQSVDVSVVLLEYFNVDSTISDTMQKYINNFNRLKLKKELTLKEENELKELEQFLGETIASNFIYDRKYLKFLEFIRDHKDIDFDKYEKITDKEMEELLKDFGDFFDD